MQAEHVDEVRVELRPPAFARHRDRRLGTAATQVDLRDVRQVHETHAEGDGVAARTDREAAPVPALEGEREPLDHPIGKTETRGQGARGHAVGRDHRGQLRPRMHHEVQQPDGPIRQRPHAADVAHEQRRELGAAPVHVVGGRPERDVVPEQLSELLRVGVAADPGEEAAVVGRLTVVRIGADQVGEPHRDQAGAQHVLHGLAETEVDGERERGDQLGAPRPPDGGTRRPHPRTVAMRVRDLQARRQPPHPNRALVAFGLWRTVAKVDPDRVRDLGAAARSRSPAATSRSLDRSTLTVIGLSSRRRAPWRPRVTLSTQRGLWAERGTSSAPRCTRQRRHESMRRCEGGVVMAPSPSESPAVHSGQQPPRAAVNRSLTGLLAADAVSTAGTEMTAVALPWFVLVSTGSPGKMGLALAAEYAGLTVLGLFGARVAGAWGPRRLMLAADLARAALILVIPLLFWLGWLSFPLILA